MVGANRQAPLACESVSIRPMETAVRPVKVPAVPVRQQNGPGKRDVKHDNRLQTVDGGLHARWEIAISDCEHHWHGLRVVHVENGDSLEFFEWTNVELQARPHLSAIQVAVLHVAFCIEDRSEEHTSELQSRSELVCRL